MSGTLILIGFCAALALVLGYLAGRMARKRASGQDLAAIFVETFPTEHPHYCAMMQQALSPADKEFLAMRVAHGPRRQALDARRRAALGFLGMLRRDYSRLDQLARALNARSTAPGQRQEWQRLRLGLQFQLLYGLIWLKVWTGQSPDRQLGLLANRIGSLASRLEIAMHAWQDASLAVGAGAVKV